jgi:hypothetical protein
MEAKRKLITASVISLLASAVALTSATFAWIKFKRSVTNMVTLSSGDTEAIVEAHVYERRYGASTTPVEVAYYEDTTNKLNVSQSSVSSGQVNVDFSSAFATDYSLSTAYYNENAAYVPALPAYYLELRILKPERYGYVGVNMQYVSVPTINSGELNFSTSYPFNYRYLAVSNSTTTPMVSAIPSQMTALEAKTLSSFFRTSTQRTSGIELFDTTDLTGAPISSTSGLAKQRYVPGFNTKVSGETVFATSVIIEISMDGALFQSFLRANPTVITNSIRFGIDFNVNVNYSNSPIWA